MDAEKVMPSVFLPVGTRKGIRPVKLFIKTLVKLSRDNWHLGFPGKKWPLI